MACRHEFLGTEKGVDCLLCGLHLTNKQFNDFLSGKPIEEKKPRKKKEVKEDA